MRFSFGSQGVVEQLVWPRFEVDRLLGYLFGAGIVRELRPQGTAPYFPSSFGGKQAVRLEVKRRKEKEKRREERGRRAKRLSLLGHH